jgi:hypothetical protein
MADVLSQGTRRSIPKSVQRRQTAEPLGLRGFGRARLRNDRHAVAGPPDVSQSRSLRHLHAADLSDVALSDARTASTLHCVVGAVEVACDRR